MTCEQFDDIVELYAGGELDREAEAAAETHLAACPACREALAAARGRLAALDAALAPCRASDDFVARTMARIPASVAPTAAAPGPERLRGRLLRYAALAAAGLLFALAGYGFLQRPPVARLNDGQVACAGPNARPLKPGTPLAIGDVLATSTESNASLELGGGQVRAVMAPATVVRITDPRSGTVVQVLRGEIYCRVASRRGSPVIASPLAKVAATRGALSLHVTPRPDAGSRQLPFEGTVTLVAHEGDARVLVPGHRLGAVALRDGQMLTLSAGRRRTVEQPFSLPDARRALLARLQEVQDRHVALEREWQLVSASALQVAAPQQPELVRRAFDIQRAMRQAEATQAEFGQRLQLLQRCQSQGRRIFRVTLRPVSDE